MYIIAPNVARRNTRRGTASAHQASHVLWYCAHIAVRVAACPELESFSSESRPSFDSHERSGGSIGTATVLLKNPLKPSTRPFRHFIL